MNSSQCIVYFAGSAIPLGLNVPSNTSCVNWNQYYTNCTPQGSNPFQGTISFDNIGLAWVAIFLVKTLDTTKGIHIHTK